MRERQSTDPLPRNRALIGEPEAGRSVQNGVLLSGPHPPYTNGSTRTTKKDGPHTADPTVMLQKQSPCCWQTGSTRAA